MLSQLCPAHLPKAPKMHMLVLVPVSQQCAFLTMPYRRQLLLMLAERLCQGYPSEKGVKHLVDSVELFIIPTMNPDGFAAHRRENKWVCRLVSYAVGNAAGCTVGELVHAMLPACLPAAGQRQQGLISPGTGILPSFSFFSVSIPFPRLHECGNR